MQESKKVFDKFVHPEPDKVDFSVKPQNISNKFKDELRSRSGSSVSSDSDAENNNTPKP
jgi:hypothetical protein